MRPLVRPLLASALAAVLLAGCGSFPSTGAAATVGGTDIPRSAIERAVEALDLDELREAVAAQLPAELSATERREAIDEEVANVVEETQRRVLDLYIRLELVRIVSDDAGVEATDEARGTARETLLASIGGEDALPEALAQAGFTEEVFEEVIVEQEALLAVLREDLLTGASLEVREPRHILVETEDAAREAIAELEEGAEFAELATEVSVDQGSAPQGGALTAAPRGTWLPAFDAAVWEAEVGEIVGPVESQAGFHVIEVVAEDERPIEELDEAQAQQFVAGELEERFSAAVTDTEVRVDPAFGTWTADPANPVLEPSEPVGDAPVSPAPGGEPGAELSEEELQELLEQLEDQ
ncbi:MAG: peptidylprolyl isomerase [Nitriliruptoraceae bacterium]